MPRKTTTKKKTTDSSEIAGLPYEQVVARLEGTVARLEAGELPLEDQLVAFEEGMILLRAGQRLLDGAERRVETLLADGSREPFAEASGQDEDSEEAASS